MLKLGGQWIKDAMQKVRITQELIGHIEAALLRGRLQPKGLDALIRKQLGHEYTHNYIDAICNGKTPSISVEVWNKVLKVISDLPDAPKTTGGHGAYTKHAKNSKGYIPLTKDMALELDAQFERVGRNYKSIVAMCPPEFHEVYKSANISNWRRGHAKSVNETAWHALLATLKSLPDKAKKTAPSKKDIPLTQRADPKKRPLRKGEGLLPISEDDIEEIKFHR